VFRRKKHADETHVVDEVLDEADALDGGDLDTDDEWDDEDADESDTGSAAAVRPTSNPARPDGPWDESETDAQEGRIDFGSLLVSPVEGLEVQVQADQATGQVSLVTLVLDQAAAQVQVFAAPKSSGLWEEIRTEIVEAIRASGGQATEVDGPFGREIDARVQPSGGATGLAPARFVGIDGPRWFLRVIFLGRAAVQGPDAAAIEAAVRGVVVVRGSAAFGPRQPLPLRIPGVPEQATAPPGLPNPFERGPEITEIR